MAPRSWSIGVALAGSALAAVVALGGCRAAGESTLEALGAAQGHATNGAVRQGPVRQGAVRQGRVAQGIVRQGIIRQGVIRQGTAAQGAVTPVSAPAAEGASESVVVDGVRVENGRLVRTR